MNWNIFRLKYDKREEWAFEQMSYLLFCAEHNNRIGLFRYKNQTGIETEPLYKDGKILGFQSKYYTTSISVNKSDIIDSINKAKAKNENLNELYFYINQEFSESTTGNQKKPKYQKEIETIAENLGIEIVWRVPSHLELQLFLPENDYILDLFFNLNPNGGKLINNIVVHNKNILKDIQTEISFNGQKIKIDRAAIIENIGKNCREYKNIIISGEGGCGKTAILKDFYFRNEKTFPICVFKANELKVSNINDIFRLADNYTLSQFIDAYKDESIKLFVIDSAEKLAEISDLDVVSNLIHELIEHGWSLIFTTRNVYLNDLSFYINEIFQFPFEVCKVSLLESDELTLIANNFGFQLPTNLKFLDRLRNLFYLKEYILHYQDINKQGNYKDFIDVLWKKRIKGAVVKDNLHIERERCMTEIAMERCNTGRFYINADHMPQHVLYMLMQDEILGYDDPHNGYFITHDIYEEWALRKIVMRNFQNYIIVKDFFETLGTSLPIRRAFRQWLSECLSENPQEIDNFIYESFSNNELEGFWKDELWVSVLLSDSSSFFFDRFETNIISDDYKLLKRILFLLRIACVDTAVYHGIEKIAPKGLGWEDAISLIYKQRKEFLDKNINIVMPVLSDWCNYNKVGRTTRNAGLLALSIIQQTEIEERFYIHSDLEEKILKIVFDAANEIKNELKNIFDKVVANHWIGHMDPYEGLCTKILEKPYIAVELIKTLPMSVIQLCDLFWKNNRDEEDFGYTGLGLNYMYGLTDSHKLDYFPASANQTPIKWLLQVAFDETLDFIISFTNTAVEKYSHSEYGLKDIKKIILHIGETDVLQYASDAVWGMHRGVIGPVVPYLLQSIHMALEKFLLEIAQHHESRIIKNILIKILTNSKSASLSSLVCSVVLAYPEKFSEIALIFFRTIELFHFDSIRQLNEFQAKLNYSIGYGLNILNDKLYTDERLKTCEEAFRNTCLESIFLNYQYFGVEGFSEEQNTVFVNSIYKILDDYKSDENLREEHGILLAKMDRRNLTAKISDHKNGGVLIEFTPKELAEDLKKKSEDAESLQKEMGKYSSLRIWSDFLHNKSVKQKEYDENPLLALSETKQLLGESESNDNPYTISYYSVPSYVCSKLLIYYSDKLSPEDKAFCKEIVVSTISNLFDDNYSYQIGDGVEAACHALPVLLNEYPEEIDDFILCMILILFDESQLGEYKRICDYIIESIHDSNLWKEYTQTAQEILRGYIKLKPIYNSIVLNLKQKQGYWGRLSKQAILTDLSDKMGNISLKDWESCKDEIEKLDIFDLGIVLQLIPSDTEDKEHKEIFEIAILKSAPELFNDRCQHDSEDNTNRFINIYRLRLTVFKQVSKFLLNRNFSEIDSYISPILRYLRATEETALFIDEMVRAEDYLCKNEQFWHIWREMYPFIKDLCLYPRSYHLKDVIISYLLAWRWWKDGIKSWHSLTIDNIDFYSTVSKELGQIPAVLYSVSRVLYTIGSNFQDDGIEWLNSIVSKNHALELNDLESNTLFYIENFMRKFILGNREKIKKDGRLKLKVIYILSFITEKGSMHGYQLRESIL